MLLTLTVRNFRSFAQETTLDLQRRSFRTLKPRNDEAWAENVYPRAAIFGANASGKTNFLRPLEILQEAVFRSLTDEIWVKALHDPHLLYEEEPSFYEVEYEVQGVRFRWNLEVDAHGVVQEELYAVPSSRWKLVFSRTRNQLKFGQVKISRAVQENMRQFMTSWSLVHSAWLTTKNPGEFSQAASWWRNGLLPPIKPSDADQDTRHKWLMRFASDGKWLNVLRVILEVADVGINDIAVEEIAPEWAQKFHQVLDMVSHAEFPLEELSSEQKSALNTITEQELKEYFRYMLFEHSDGKQVFRLHEAEESQGTRTWIDLVVPALLALTSGRVMVVDEIDSSLHPYLVRELVDYFADPEMNTKGAQLLFTSHDITLIGKHPTDLLERGEVWFAEKKNSYSDLVALDEFPVRPVHNIEKQYLEGSFGALPFTDRTKVSTVLDTLRK
ncbi:ATP-binding protein [Corynebacterium sp. sy017]|uniref:AAA family ATPase n=1 Tax=unclassified Corynebacterium TaxID=2624378 RepID=UPI0011870861|nr:MULTISPECIES: ATP-binding protein [unclassified Corynebacterium]MBP3088422.1 ATP-binding protein [Corynebacterium sp. sy017]TSD91733.1 ATP-binding protein [Corynebacterium sp. SY003]